MGRAGERYLSILRELSKAGQAQPVTLAEVGRRLGLSRQLVHKYVKELARMGYVAKVGRHYVLTDRGKEVLDLASEKIAELREVFKALIAKITEVGLGIVRKGGEFCVSLDAYLAALVLYLLTSLWEASTVIDPKSRDEVLDKLWTEELKGLAKSAIYLLELCGVVGVGAINRMIQYNLFAALYNIALTVGTQRVFEANLKILKLLEEMYGGLQKNAGRSQ
jgi:DNA-binding MarR family transcriptional regulator